MEFAAREPGHQLDKEQGWLEPLHNRKLCEEEEQDQILSLVEGARPSGGNALGSTLSAPEILRLSHDFKY